MGFKKYNPDGYPSEYEPLHDPHLKKYIQRTRLKRKLHRKGLITCDACVKCTLKDFNSYRLYLNSVYLFYEKYGVSLQFLPDLFVPYLVGPYLFKQISTNRIFTTLKHTEPFVL